MLRAFRGELWAAMAPNGQLGDEWSLVPDDLRARLRFIECVKDERGLSTKPGRINFGGNSGYQAIGLAYAWGAQRVILLGYDMQRTGGKTHHHGDHAGGLPNLGNLEDWRARMNELAVDLRKQGIAVHNATRETALTCFERVVPDRIFAEKPITVIYHVQGMHGLGDNLHQRAVVRRLMQHGSVFLETPWPSLYHDLVGERLRLINKRSSLRTQAKNAAREASKYHSAAVPIDARTLRVGYSPQMVREQGSFLAAMAANSGMKAKLDDFRLPIAPAWDAKAQRWLDKWKPTKPLMIYRPLVERTEWVGCSARNPDAEAYAALFRAIRGRYFVVSVADLEPGVEWESGIDVKPDVACHKGELDVETLAALTARAALVFCSPGFAIVLAQAVGTPLVAVFGGHESGRLYNHGERKNLFIDPIQPCECFSKAHACRKAIDMPKALARLREFLRPEVTLLPRRAALPQFPPRFFNPGELDALVYLIASVKPKTVVEFGCNEGRAAATIMLNVPTIKQYTGIDVLPGYVTIKECQRNEIPSEPGKYAKADPRFRVILRRRGAFDLKPSDLPKADAIFIDADHSRAGVLNDYALAKAIVRPGGIIIFHDDNGLPVVEVTPTLEELREQGAQIIHVADTWLAFERI